MAVVVYPMYVSMYAYLYDANGFVILLLVELYDRSEQERSMLASAIRAHRY